MSLKSEAGESFRFGVVILILMILLGLGGLGLAAARMGVLPWFVEAERRVYEESRSHVDGTNKQIARLGIQAEQLGSSIQQKAIINHLCVEASQIDMLDLTTTARRYVSQYCGNSR